MTDHMKLSLVVIARNEAHRLPRLLRSVAPWVDHMLVLDTGSSDATIPVAREHGAEVRSFRWCDDFAAARNAALDRAVADWHLVLDADEWLVEGGDAIAALRSTPPTFVGTVRLDDHDGLAAAPAAHSWLSRVLPGSVRYAGRVHEQPSHALPTLRLPVVVGHDGYAAERLAAKRGRNRRLLEQAVAEQPADAYLWYQLGKDAQVYGEDGVAEPAFARAQRLAPPGSPWLTDLATRRLYGLKRLGRHAEGLALAEAVGAASASAPDLPFALGDLLLDWAAGCPQRAPQLLAAAEAAWRHCLALGERVDQTGSVPGRGSHLAAHNLALVLEGTGRTDEARHLRRHYGLPDASLLA